MQPLTDGLGRFNREYQKNYNLFQSTADNYKNDFSLICRQEYVDALAIFPVYQNEIKLLLEAFISKADGKADAALLNHIKGQYEVIKGLDFKSMIYSYINACNTFITLFKVPKVNTFEERLEIAKPLLAEWEKYMISVNSFVEAVKALGNLLNAFNNEKGE